MESVWRDDRNRMRVDLVKDKLAIRINFDMSCEEFLKFIKKKTEQSEMVADAKSQKKIFV